MTIARPTSDLLVGGWSGVNAPSLLASRKVVTTSPEEHRELDWSNPLNNGAVSVLHANCLVDLKSRSRAYTAFIYNRVPTAHGTAIRMAATTTQGFYSTAPDLPHTGKGATYFWVGTTGPNIPSMTSVAGDGSFGFFTIGGVGLLAVLGATVGSVNALGPLAYLPTNTFCVLVLTATSSGNWRVYLNGEMRASGSAPTMENNTCYGLCLGNFNRSMSYSSPEDHQMAGKYVGNVWSQDQVESFSANPWQIFKPKQSVSYTNPSADLYSALDEASVDDADYITTSTASTCELALTPVTDPATSTGQVVTIRAKSVAGSTLVATLKQPEIPGYTGGLFLPRRWESGLAKNSMVNWAHPLLRSVVSLRTWSRVLWNPSYELVDKTQQSAFTNGLFFGRDEGDYVLTPVNTYYASTTPSSTLLYPKAFTYALAYKHISRLGTNSQFIAGEFDQTLAPLFGFNMASGATGEISFYQKTSLNSNSTLISIGRSLRTDKISKLVGTFDGSTTCRCYQDKSLLGTATIFSASAPSFTTKYATVNYEQFQSNLTGKFYYTLTLAREWSYGEIASWSENIWQIFKPRKHISYFSTPSTPGTIATRTFSSLGSSFADYQINLTPTECNLITDYNNLSISLEAQ
jgi:hypothetical protein